MANEAVKSFQQIWKQMDNGRRRQAATAFFNSTETMGEKKRISGFLAMKFKLRPQTAAKLPAERAGGYLASFDTLDEPLAALLIRSYLFDHQQAMLVMFLDAVQMPHEKGVIPEGNTIVPTAEALHAGVEKIRSAFPAEDVDLYLSALLASDAETWVNLPEALGQKQE